MENKKNIALFEKYLEDKLSPIEKSDFEKRLDDIHFKEEFESYKNLIKELKEGIDYSEKRKKLNKIHDDIYGNKRSFYLNPKFYMVLSIAACFILFIYINPFLSKEDTMAEESSEYVELYNSDDAMESVEEEIDATHDEMTYVQLNPQLKDSLIDEISLQPLGTAFLINEYGVFITSKHLVDGREIVSLQNKDSEIVFEASVIYLDSIMDIAILKCHENITEQFNRVPFKFNKTQPQLGEEVFTLGYPKKDIVYTTGVVSSENGYKSDSLYIEISMPSSPGYSGAPLFNENGFLVGIITANNSKKQSVTYSLKHHYITKLIDNLEEQEIIDIDLSNNYSKKYKNRSRLIEKYRPFIFEVH